MSAERVTFVPSALLEGPRPAEREIYRKAPPAVGDGRPAAPAQAAPASGSGRSASICSPHRQTPPATNIVQWVAPRQASSTPR